MEQQNDINFSDLMMGRVVQQTKNLTISNVEKLYISDLFKDDFYLSTNFSDIEKVLSTIKTLDKNFFYDIYKFSYEDIDYAIKVGSKEDSEIFDKERIALEKLKDKELAPTYLSSGRSETYAYLLTSFEHGISAKSAGLSVLFDNLELFAKNLAQLHNETKSEDNERDYFLESCYSLGSFDIILSEDVFQEMKEVKNFKTCQQLLKDIKESIAFQMPDKPEKYSSLCHTHLVPSNILFRADYADIKFCNFYNSFTLNPMWDLAFLAIKLDLNRFPQKEKQFLDHYFKHSYLNSDDYSIVYFKQVAFKIVLFKLVSMYFLKLVIPEDSGSILDMFKLYGHISNMVADEFSEYKETLDEMFGNFSKSI